MKSAYDQATRIEEIDEETEVFDEIDFESRLASLHNSYGVQLGQSGQTRLAKEEFETALKYNPHDAIIVNNLRIARGY